MVPAEEMRFTPVDRLFTRMGAGDNMVDGESTFFVELSETVNILQNATKRSMVILDELGQLNIENKSGDLCEFVLILGRGTSTHDGCAIALAVTHHFGRPENSCLVMFTTHYHQMVRYGTDHSPINEFYHEIEFNLGTLSARATSP